MGKPQTELRLSADSAQPCALLGSLQMAAPQRGELLQHCSRQQSSCVAPGCPLPRWAAPEVRGGARTPLRAVSPKPAPSWGPGRANPPRKGSQIPPVPPLPCGQSSAPHHAGIPPARRRGAHGTGGRSVPAELSSTETRGPQEGGRAMPRPRQHGTAWIWSPTAPCSPGCPPPGASRGLAARVGRPPVRTRPAARPLRPGPAAFFCLVWPEPGRPGRDEGPGTAPVALQHLGPSRRPVPGRAAPPAPQCPAPAQVRLGHRPSGGGSPLPPAPSSGEPRAAPTGREGAGGSRG